MANTIEVGLSLSLDEYNKSLKGAEEKGRKSGKKTGDGFSDGAAASMKNFAKVATGIFAGIAATVGAFKFGQAAVAASIVQQDAINSLETSLRLAGRFSEEASTSFQDFASSLQEVSTVGDETTLRLGGLASNFARSNEEAQKMTLAAIELSAAMGTDAESALKNLGKSFSGLTGELGEALPIIKELTVEQLKSGAAIDLILSRFGGSAASKINTFSGAMAQLTNIFGDVQERVGDLVTSSPAVVALIKAVSEQFSAAGKSVKEFGASGDIIGEMLLKVIKFSEGVNLFLIAPLELGVNAIKLAFNSVSLFITQSISTLAEAAGKVISFFSPDSALAQNIKAFADFQAGVAVDLAATTQESLGNLFNFDVSAGAQTFLESTKAVIDNAKAVIANAGLENQVKKTADNIGVQIAGINKMILNGLKNAAIAGVAAIGGALVRGENAFSAFGSAVLGIIGDMAIQIGSTLVSIGLGIDALKGSLLKLSGGAAIAAGFALIALGGALKALSSGGGVAAPSAGGGGVAGGGIQPTPEDIVGPSPEDNELKSPNTEVVVNVQGNVFDRKETGMEIVNAIREHFDSEGGVLVS